MFFFEKDELSKIEQISVEYAYLSIVSDELESAKVIFRGIDSSRANWGCFLVEALTGFVKRMPTYLEIRSFLEIDLDFLIKNQKIDYVESLLGATEYLININQETYKFVARVMYENSFYEACFNYLEKSKKIFYKDPELHFLYAKYYMNKKEILFAKFHIDECLKFLPDYYPAQKLNIEVSKYLA